MSAMKKTLNDEYNVAFTENGAAGYRTTGKSLSLRIRLPL